MNLRFPAPHLPDAACQTHCTVIKLELDGPLDFHASVGEVVTQN